jgi:hypothetical protein
MHGIIITSEEKENLELLKKMAEKLKMRSKDLSDEDIEDMALLEEMKKVDKSQTVSEETIFNDLDA